MPPTTNVNFPSFESVLNNCRAICNDSFAGYTSTAGEGQVVTDFLSDGVTVNPFVINHLNSSIRELYRKIRATDQLLIQDNYVLTNLSVVTGPLGAGVADPTVQVYLDSTGFYNGTSYNNTQKLPTDLYLPIRLWERQAGTTDSLAPMTQTPNGLPPRNQVDRFSEWEYRNGAIYFVGATTARDIRIRYVSLFPTNLTPTNFSTTYIPVLDSDDYLAYRTAEKIALSLGNPQVSATLKGESDAAIFALKNERVRRMQQNNGYRRPGYNDGDLGAELDLYGI